LSFEGVPAYAAAMNFAPSFAVELVKLESGREALAKQHHPRPSRGPRDNSVIMPAAVETQRTQPISTCLSFMMWSATAALAFLKDNATYEGVCHTEKQQTGCA
jgi:hypothetical protein